MSSKHISRPKRKRKPSSRVIRNFETQFNNFSPKIPFTCKECEFSSLSIRKFLLHVVEIHMQRKSEKSNDAEAAAFEKNDKECGAKEEEVHDELNLSFSSYSKPTPKHQKISAIKLRKFSISHKNSSVGNDCRSSNTDDLPKDSDETTDESVQNLVDNDKISKFLIGDNAATSPNSCPKAIQKQDHSNFLSSENKFSQKDLFSGKNSDASSSSEKSTSASLKPILSQGNAETCEASLPSPILPFVRYESSGIESKPQPTCASPLQTSLFGITSKPPQDSNSASDSIDISSLERESEGNNEVTVPSALPKDAMNTKDGVNILETKETVLETSSQSSPHNSDLKIVSVYSNATSKVPAEQTLPLVPYSSFQLEKSMRKSSKKMATLLQSGVVTLCSNFNSTSLPQETVEKLEKSFVEFPYPPIHRLRELSKVTKLSVSKIKSWFVNTRLLNGVSWDPDEIHDAWAYMRDYQSDEHG